MPNRATRRAALRKADKLACKAGIGPVVQPVPATQTDFPEPGRPFPLLEEISPSRLAANRENAQKSTGPITDEGKAISSQNRLTHGLARHNGRFALLPTEDSAEFDTLRATYMSEHAPANQTESDLVQVMVETLWLRNRAQNLQPSCFDPNTGALADAKLLALFIRYENTYNRAFSTAFRDLLKARAERRKLALGFEAQKRQAQAAIRAQEKHQMQKDKHFWEVLKKDAAACHELTRNLTLKMDAKEKNPEFAAELAAEFAQHHIKRTIFDAGIAA